jgi:prolyl-tRNA synthetase
MASQNPSDVPATEAAPQALPDRTQNPADNQAGESKNAAKKAAKLAKLQADKADKKASNKGEKGIAKPEAKKAAKKKVDGAALIGIDVSKEEDFPGWYQQVLTKGDMLDYYDISGCFILKVGHLIDPNFNKHCVNLCLARLILHLGGDPKFPQQKDQETWRQELLIPSICV